MAERKTLSKKIRFEVFKRDSFRCQYCGRSAPDVILEVDHLVPVSKGGKNDIMNLITSCRDCNRGKGKRELSDKDVLEKQKAELDALNEKREQMEMMIQWREELISFADKEVDLIDKLVNSLTGGELDANQKRDIRSLIKRFGYDEVYTSTEIAINRYYKEYFNGGFENSNFKFVMSKIGGVCYNRIKQGDAGNGNI